ncbi:dentin sialophosphoprotein-like isoform X8 [Littorina saxatilis]|uniref:dentin sialophosphoprotein-like isoform X8 n=1 Tax=Littorina saxatilis TaxID=31220 RepID=UPI0038B4B1A0
MEKLDDEAAAKFISALTKSVQTLCHGFLDFHTGVEILGYINLNVDKGSKLHYVLEEKVCKNEENSTLFISNSFHAQNQKQDKGKDSESESSGSTGAHRSNSTDNGERSRVSSAISSISTALSRSHEKFPLDSTSSAKDAADMVQSRPISNTSKRKASDDLNSDIRSAKSSHMRSSPSPVSHFLSHSQSPHGRTGRTSPIDRKPSVSELRGENSSGTVLPQTAGISGDGAGDLGVNLAGSVLERVDDHSNSDLPDRGDDSDGDLEVTFIKEEYMEGEQSSCQFENSTGQFGRGTNRRASSTDNMPDASLYPISLHPSASATYVPGSQDMASAQHYGPSTSSQPGASGVRGTYPAQSDSSACDQKMLEASQLFQGSGSHQQPPHPLPQGMRPGCGYVHPTDAQAWLMYELVPGSGVFIHQENYHTVISKKRDGQPDGKAMARYLMSCFWKQADLVGASIADPPRPHHRSLDKGIINAILDFSSGHSQTKRSQVRACISSTITKASSRFRQMQGLPVGKPGRPLADI